MISFRNFLAASGLSLTLIGSPGFAEENSDLIRWAADYRAGSDDALVSLHIACFDLNYPVCGDVATRENLGRAAGRGHAGAQALLGSLMLSDAVDEENRDVALGMLNLAIDQDHPAAMIAVADFLVGENGDLVRARSLYQRAFEIGASLGAYRLGVLDQLGVGVATPDPVSAQRYLEAAAEMDNPLALNALGALTLADVDNPDRLKNAESFFRNAHNLGLDDATHQLVDVLLAVPNPELNYFEASFLLESAAQGGNVEAQFRWGTWLLEGIGVPRDLEGARHWLESAAQAGHSRAALALATSYRPFIDTGFDFYSSTDIDQTLFWLNQAMAAEIPEAFYLAGRIHFDGDGDRPPDRRKAEGLLERALQLGLDPQFEGRAEFVFSQAESLRISRQRAMEQQALQVFFIGVLLYGAFNGGGGSSGSQDCFLASCNATFSSTGNAGADMLGYSLMMR